MQLLGRLAIMVSGTAGTMGLGLLRSVLVARLLGPGELAWYATVSLAVNLGAQLSDCGLANAFAFYARQQQSALRSLLRGLVRHVIASSLVAAVAAVVLVAIRPWGLEPAFGAPHFAVALVVFFAATSATTLLSVLVLARGQYQAYVTFTNATIVVHLIFIVAAFIAVGASWRAFITAAAAAQLLVAVMQFLYVRQLLPAAADRDLPASRTYAFGLRIKVAEIMKLMSGKVDLLIVAALLPARDVGIYSLALTLREFGMTPLRTYSGLLQNVLVDRQQSGMDDRVVVLGSMFLQVCVSLALCIAAALAFPSVLPLLYGEDYRSLAGPAVVALLGTVFLSVVGISLAVFNMRGRPTTGSAVVTASGLIGPPLVYVLARSYGLYGAAAAGVLTAALSAVLALVVLFRVCHYRLADLPFAVRRVGRVIRGLRSAPAHLRPPLQPSGGLE